MTKKKMSLSEIKNINTIVNVYTEYIETYESYDDGILKNLTLGKDLNKKDIEILTDFVQLHYCGNRRTCVKNARRNYDIDVIEKFEIRPQSSQSINDGGYYKRRVIKVIRKY